MAAKIQRAFLDTASAPLLECATRIRASRLRDALEAVSPAKLENALHNGLAAVAAQSGASLAALEGAAPMAEVDASMARLEAAHRAASEVLVRFLATTVTLAPPSPEPGSAGDELRRVAARYALDRHIAEPLEALADELAAWQTQLESLAVVLAKDRSVIAAQVRRWLVRGAIAVAALVVIGSLAAFFAWSRLVVRAARDRVAVSLASPDPCTWESVSDKDLAHATPAQKADYEARKLRCEMVRARQAYEVSCTALADHVDAGAWNDADAPAAGASAPLLRRIAGRSLEPADLLIDGKTMPCQDTQIAERLWQVFGKTAAGSPGLWASAERVSPHVASLLRRPGLALTAEADEAQLAFSDGLAKRAIKTGHPEELARATLVCKLRPSLGLVAGRGCAALERIMSR